MTLNARVGEFPVWLELEVGGRSRDELLAEIEKAGMFATDYTKDIMSKDAWRPGERENVRFAKAQVRELGFTQDPTNCELCDRIEELGFSPCEPCDGPALRIAFKDQPWGMVCWTVMKQITFSVCRPAFFALERNDDGEMWLSGLWNIPDGRWNIDDEAVFRLRKCVYVKGHL